MAKVEPRIHLEIDPRLATAEVCAVIAAVLPYHPPDKHDKILEGIQDAISKKREQLNKQKEGEKVG